MSLEVAESVRDQILRIMEITEADTMTEVIRRAVKLYEVLHAEAGKGNVVVVRKEDGSEQQLLMV
jgi:hypothetical protein